MDEIFHNVHGLQGAFTVVKVAAELPRRYGKHGEVLIRYDDTEEAREVERRRSSVVAGAAEAEAEEKHGGAAERFETASGKS